LAFLKLLLQAGIFGLVESLLGFSARIIDDVVVNSPKVDSTVSDRADEAGRGAVRLFR